MSYQAMRWVAFLPVSTTGHGARSVLLLLAEMADHEGKGTFPSVRTMAGVLGVTERSVRRWLVELRESGLISPGDQHLADYLRADRRPVVWDLPIASANLIPDGVTGWSGRDPDGVTSRAPRGDSQRPHGVTAAVPESRLESVVEPPRASRDARGTGGPSAVLEDPIGQALATIVGAMPPAEGRKVGEDYRRPRDGQSLRAVVRELLAHGWLPGQIATEVSSRSWSGVGHPPSALLGRLERALSRPAPGAVVTRVHELPWCGDEDCDEGSRHRTYVADDGKETAGPCHECSDEAARRRTQQAVAK